LKVIGTEKINRENFTAIGVQNAGVFYSARQYSFSFSGQTDLMDDAPEKVN
jgi:hypothetical protein